jgi:hypothetical protein
LVLSPDHTFEQTVSALDVAKHAQGSWEFNQHGDIAFSKAFLKTDGEALTEDETASCGDPRGSNYLSIEVDMTSKSGSPTFRKKLLTW